MRLQLQSGFIRTRWHLKYNKERQSRLSCLRKDTFSGFILSNVSSVNSGTSTKTRAVAIWLRSGILKQRLLHLKFDFLIFPIFFFLLKHFPWALSKMDALLNLDNLTRRSFYCVS